MPGSPIPRIAATLLALQVGGCSFVFSEGRPVQKQERPFLDCGESYAPPVVDTVAAALLGLALVGSKQTPDMTRAQYRGSLVFLATFAAVDAASALYGYHAVADCRAAKEERALVMARAALLPPPYGLPPWGVPPPWWPPRIAVPAVAAPSP